MRLTDRQLDSLLAEGKLSGPESDRILEDVLQRTARGARWRLWLPLSAGLGLASAGAALLLLNPFGGGAPSGFTARGGGDRAPAADLQVACLGGSLSACPRGS